MSTNIESEIIKLEAHNIAVGHLEDDLKEVTQLIKDKRNEEDGITQGQIDADALSHNTEDQDNILAMQQKVISIKAQLTLINKFKDVRPSSIADPGSLVFVQDQAFYVSTSVESFHHKGHKITCISVDTPMYKGMKGLKAGDNFVCNGKNYTIQNIA